MAALDETLEAAFVRGEASALAVARARAYTLFAAWIRRGLDADTLEPAEGLEELTAALSAWRAPGTKLDFEQAAAAHQRLLGHEVFPLASAFLADDGCAGGEVTADAHAALREAGVPWDPTAESADHLAVLLDALAFLSGAEAEALRDENLASAGAARHHAAGLIQSQVLTWWAPFAHALHEEGERFFSTLIDMVQALLLDHLDEELPDPPRPARPEPPSLSARLDDPSVGLREIAEHLVQPARSGVFLSRGALRRLARGVGVPFGFGTRANRLETLLRASAEAEHWPRAIELLEARLEAAARAASEAPGGGVWKARLSGTRSGLTKLRRAAP